jgi:hypothetical protein
MLSVFQSGCASRTRHCAGSSLHYKMSPFPSSTRGCLYTYTCLPASATNNPNPQSSNTFCSEYTMGIWDNVRSDLRLRNLSTLCLSNWFACECQHADEDQPYTHNGINSALLPYCTFLSHTRTSILAAVLLYFPMVSSFYLYLVVSLNYLHGDLTRFLLITLGGGPLNL